MLLSLHLTYRFKFPSVFIIYQMFPLGLFEIFLLIAFTDRERLFCSKRDVIGSLANSTPFCTIQGVFRSIQRLLYSIQLHCILNFYAGLVFHYITLQTILLWLFHILAIFCGIKFPIRAKIIEMKGYFRYVHFIMLGLAIVLPCIPIAVVQATGGSKLATFPPFQCYAGNSDVVYYTFILPGSIMLGTGITLVILTLHMIIHATELRRKFSHQSSVRTEVQNVLINQLITFLLLLRNGST